MKALSIRQPWAWLIATGLKDVENRTWRTSFRGPFLIHAGSAFDAEGYAWVVSTTGLVLPRGEQFDRGGIVGKAEIIDCVTESNSRWYFGPYGFIIRNARVLPFLPMKGKLGFFDVELQPGERH